MKANMNINKNFERSEKKCYSNIYETLKNQYITIIKFMDRQIESNGLPL